MDKIFAEVFRMAKQQGFSFVLLAFAVWWFSVQHNKLEIKVDQCNEALIEAYREQNLRIITTLEKNVEIMENFSRSFEESNKK